MAMVMVVRDVGIALFGNSTVRVSEAVLDRRTASVIVHGALHLVGRGGGTPSEASGKAGGRGLPGRSRYGGLCG